MKRGGYEAGSIYAEGNTNRYIERQNNKLMEEQINKTLNANHL